MSRVCRTKCIFFYQTSLFKLAELVQTPPSFRVLGSVYETGLKLELELGPVTKLVVIVGANEPSFVDFELGLFSE